MRSIAIFEEQNVFDSVAIKVCAGNLNKLLSHPLRFHNTKRVLPHVLDNDCQQLITAAKPTFLDNVKSNILAGGVGAVLPVVAILLL